MSNLSFTSKVLEKVVSARLTDHLESNNLMDFKECTLIASEINTTCVKMTLRDLHDGTYGITTLHDQHDGTYGKV